MPPMCPLDRTASPNPAAERSLRPVVSRACIGALASALALLQLLGLAHFLLVPHEVCADHGELVNGHADVSAVHHAVTRGAVLDHAEAGDRYAAGHDHCSVFVHQRSRALVGPTTAAPTPVAPAPSLLAPVEHEVPAPVAVLFFAPKSSPPAC